MNKQDRIIELLKLNPNLSNTEIKSKIKCTSRTIRYAKMHMRNGNKNPEMSKEYTFEEKDNSAIISSKRFISTQHDRAKVLEDFLMLCQVDTKVWETDRYLLNAWDVTMSADKSSTKKDATYTNYQIKVWLKKRGDSLSIQEIKDEFAKQLKEHKPYKYSVVKRIKSTESGNAAEISIHDLHYGSLCWKPETGENYDIKIAERLFLNAIDNLMVCIKPYGLEEIVMPIGSDFFNVNSKLNTTVAGTSQDEDCRWQKTFMYGARMVIKAVDALRTLAPTKVLIIPGNHDEERAFYLGEYINAWYKDCNNVNIDNAPNTRKYWWWGKCLLGFTHGSEEVKGTLPLIMATEVPHLWSLTKYREWHTGHLHSKSVKSYDYATENNGIRERIMPSLAATDSWHKKKGYSGLRSAEAFIWNKETGNKARFSYQPN